MASLRSLAVASFLALLACAPALSSRAQENAVTVLGLARLNPQSNSVSVDIRVNTSVAVSAFHFLLVFDPAVLHLRTVSEGAFLQSSGRDPVCDKTIEPGAVLVECALPPSPADEAPSGLGELASLDFEPVQRGDARLILSHVVLRGGDGSVIASTVQQTNFAVPATSDNSVSRGRIGILVALAGGLAVVLLIAGGYLVRTKVARRALG